MIINRNDDNKDSNNNNIDDKFTIKYRINDLMTIHLPERRWINYCSTLQDYNYKDIVLFIHFIACN